MSLAALHPWPIHQQTIKVEEVSADVGVGSFARDSLVKAENTTRSDDAPAGPALKLPRKPSKGQSGHDNNRRRAPQRSASSRARIGVSKAYAPLLVPASVEELSGTGPSQVLDDNSDTEMLLNIDDLIGDLDSSDNSDGYTEAGAAQASSRRSRRGALGKRKGGAPAQQGGEGNAVGGKRSRRGGKLDREDWMLIRGEDVAKRKSAARRRRICLLSEEERGGLDREKIEKLVDFMAETIDWGGALRAIRGGHTASVSGGPSIKDSEDLSLPTEALSGHWRDVLSKRLAEMYPL
ncbi:MAG: hypothetical protein M1839_008495 [Geoglossum umbratile]|nr:MAG: hypothetical protein M1839_008495 [Geoglossum umbratile]